MTLPYERTRAVLATRLFLLNLTDSKVTPHLPKNVRDNAKNLLRHYPSESDLKTTHRGWTNEVVKFTIECPFGDPDDR